MNTNKFQKMMRLPDVMDMTGMGHSTIYEHIKLGLFPDSVKLSKRLVAWPSWEISTLMSARIAGKNNQEICEIVSQLLSSRKNFSINIYGQPEAGK